MKKMKKDKLRIYEDRSASLFTTHGLSRRYEYHEWDRGYRHFILTCMPFCPMGFDRRFNPSRLYMDVELG